MARVRWKQPKTPKKDKRTPSQQHSEPDRIIATIHKSVCFKGCEKILLIVPNMFSELTSLAVEKIQNAAAGEVFYAPKVTPEIEGQIKSGEFSICLRLDKKTGIITPHSRLENIRMYGGQGKKHAEMMA